MLLLAMIVLASADILLRMVSGGGLVWVSPLVRVMVLWLGLLGALLATRDNQHISIDLLSRLLGDGIKRWSQSITNLFATMVCAVTAWYSIEFVQGSLEYADTIALGKQDAPAWILQIVIPLSFGLMSLRFLIHAIGFAVVSGYDPRNTDETSHADKLEKAI